MKLRPVIFVLFAAVIFFSCSNESDRKIRLASEESSQGTAVQAVSSVLQVPQGEQHTVAILPFENLNDEEKIDWLRRGLADMLTAELAQSTYLSVVSINELYEEMNQNLSSVLATTKPSKAETILSGSFLQDDNGLQIEVKLLDVASGQVFKSESVNGESLEQIFLMVDDLSDRLRTNLRGELEATREKRLSLAKMTNSVEAFRCYSEALTQMDKFNFGEAEACLEEAIAYDSTFAKGHLLLGKVKYHFGDVDGFENSLQKARKYIDRLSEPDRLWLRLYEAELAGDLEEILEAMEELLQYETNDAETRMQVAQLFYGLKDFDRALAEYEFVLELDPTQKLALNYIAYIYAHRGDFNTALKYLDKYQKLAPDEPNPHDSRGEILLMSGRIQEAAEQFQLSLSKRPDFDNSIKNLVQVYAELGDQKQALKYADIRIENAPNVREQGRCYMDRAVLNWRFAKLENARADLRMARQTTPNSVYPVLIGAEMLNSTGAHEVAQKLQHSYYEQLVELQKEKLHPYEVEGIIRFCMESSLSPEKTLPILEMLRRSEEREILKMQYDFLMAILHLRMGNEAKAAELCEEPREELFRLVTQFPNQGWSGTWKYAIEAIQLEPKMDKMNPIFAQELLEAGRASGRQDIKAIAKFFHALYYAKYGDQQRLVKTYHELGSPLEDDWKVIGPFANRSGFERAYPPEESVDIDGMVKVGDEILKWQHVNDGIYDGYVDLTTTLQPSSWAVGYAALTIHSPDKRKVQLRLASDEACKLWLNGKQVWQAFRLKDVAIDQDIVSVYLHPGENKLLLKITNSTRDWGFYFRVTNDNGQGFSDITFRAPGGEEGAVARR